MAPLLAEAAGPCGRHSLLRTAPPRPPRGLRLGRGPGGVPPSLPPASPPTAVLSRAGGARPRGDSAWLEAPGGSGEPARSESAGYLMINCRRRWLSLVSGSSSWQ